MPKIKKPKTPKKTKQMGSRASSDAQMDAELRAAKQQAKAAELEWREQSRQAVLDTPFDPVAAAVQQMRNAYSLAELESVVDQPGIRELYLHTPSLERLAYLLLGHWEARERKLPYPEAKLEEMRSLYQELVPTIRPRGDVRGMVGSLSSRRARVGAEALVPMDVPTYEDPHQFQNMVDRMVEFTVDAPNAAMASAYIDRVIQAVYDHAQVSGAQMQYLIQIGMYLRMLAAKQTALSAAPPEVRDSIHWHGLGLRFKGTGYVSGRGGSVGSDGPSSLYKYDVERLPRRAQILFAADCIEHELSRRLNTPSQYRELIEEIIQLSLAVAKGEYTRQEHIKNIRNQLVNELRRMNTPEEYEFHELIRASACLGMSLTDNSTDIFLSIPTILGSYDEQQLAFQRKELSYVKSRFAGDIADESELFAAESIRQEDTGPLGPITGPERPSAWKRLRKRFGVGEIVDPDEDEGDVGRAVQKRKAQSVIVSKEVARTLQAAKAIVTRTGHKAGKVDETEHYWRFRQAPPEKFREGSFQTWHLGLPEGVKVIAAIPKRGQHVGAADFAHVPSAGRPGPRQGVCGICGGLGGPGGQNDRRATRQ